MDQGLPAEFHQDKSYLLSGKIMISAIVILFVVVAVMVCLHLYARWYVVRLRRLRRGRTSTVIFVENHNDRSVADRGLEPSVLNSLPVFQYSLKAAAEQPSGPVECAVCLSEFEGNEIVRLLPKCGHSFHVDCIGMWFHSHSTCPLCRSPVDAVVDLTEPSLAAEEAVEEGNRSEPSSSSGTGLCSTCQHENENTNTTSLWGRRKAIAGGIIGIRIDAPPLRWTESENELTQSSPGSRLLSLRRLFSMTRKTPTGSGVTTPHFAAGTSGGAAELDLEGGLSEPSRLQTPR